MAKQYSDDKNTAINGGVINTFSRGKLNSKEFENVAFGLTEVNEISQPFKTEYGWHIVKLLEKNPIKSFEDEKVELSRRMKGDIRAQLIREDVLKDIKETYNVKEDEEALAYFTQNVSDDILSSRWDIADLKDIPQKNIIEIKGEGKSYEDFAKLMSNAQRQIGNVYFKESLIANWLEMFKENFLISYHKDHLEETNKEYAYIIEEYRNGLLLFELMEDNIWQAAKEDSIKGVVLMVNSPGGTIFGSNAILDGVKEYKNETGKPVIAFVTGMAASGGYWASLGADEIIADSGSTIGSIGVIF